jgi:hypothetical protein
MLIMRYNYKNKLAKNDIATVCGLIEHTSKCLAPTRTCDRRGRNAFKRNQTAMGKRAQGEH